MRFFDRSGVAAPLAYVGFVTVKAVVAPIPGTMLHAPGGVIFGGFLAGLLSLAGNVIGAGIACQLDRKATFSGIIPATRTKETGVVGQK